MTLDKLFRIALEHFPMAHITEDLDGEIRIHTGLMYEPLWGIPVDLRMSRPTTG